MLEKLFGFSSKTGSIKTEVLAGITTFMTMAYILAVNPDILSTTGMDKNAVFTATALSAIIGMLAYVLLKVFTGKFKDVSIVMYILAVLFILKFFI